MSAGPDAANWLSIVPLDGQLSLLGTLLLALVLSSLIGLEREMRMKSAGLRTNTLVGVASCLIMLVSKYGFGDVLRPYEVALDPSRIAAQIISGIGFIGGGLIFVQRDVVRGLTTAATIWLTAAVGMACGAGLPVLALAVTGFHFLVVHVYAPLVQRFLADRAVVAVELSPGTGTVQRVMDACRGAGYTIDDVQGQTGRIELRISGGRRLGVLLVALRDLEGVERAEAH